MRCTFFDLLLTPCSEFDSCTLAACQCCLWCQFRYPQEATKLAATQQAPAAAEREPEVVLEMVRCTTHLGMYTAFEDGELLLKFGNYFSWFRHKRVQTTTFKQHPWDFDPSDEEEDEEGGGGGAACEVHGNQQPQQLTLQVAAGPLRDAILKRNLGICRQIIAGGTAGDPVMLANLYWEPAKRFTLLHYAAAQNAAPFAQLLLSNGAALDVQSIAPHGAPPTNHVTESSPSNNPQAGLRPDCHSPCQIHVHRGWAMEPGCAPAQPMRRPRHGTCGPCRRTPASVVPAEQPWMIDCCNACTYLAQVSRRSSSRPRMASLKLSSCWSMPVLASRSPLSGRHRSQGAQ